MAHCSFLGLAIQDVYLYAGIVFDNLRLGLNRLFDRELRVAYRMVGINCFIERLSHGYNKSLGPGARYFSARKCQPRACARVRI